MSKIEKYGKIASICAMIFCAVGAIICVYLGDYKWFIIDILFSLLNGVMYLLQIDAI